METIVLSQPFNPILENLESRNKDIAIIFELDFSLFKMNIVYPSKNDLKNFYRLLKNKYGRCEIFPDIFRKVVLLKTERGKIAHMFQNKEDVELAKKAIEEICNEVTIEDIKMVIRETKEMNGGGSNARRKLEEELNMKNDIILNQKMELLKLKEMLKSAHQLSMKEQDKIEEIQEELSEEETEQEVEEEVGNILSELQNFQTSSRYEGNNSNMFDMLKGIEQEYDDY